MNDASGGHAHCANCGAALADRYCGRCGQDSHVSLSLGHFLHEFVEGLFHVDSKFWRTLRTLLTRPGLLTEQYLGGKRQLVLAAVSQLSRDLDRSTSSLASIFDTPASQVVSAGGREMQASDCAQIGCQSRLGAALRAGSRSRACAR